MVRSELPSHSYSELWLRPLQERVQQFRRGSPRILYYQREPNTSTFRYRLFNTARALSDHHGEASASWFFEADGSAVLDLVREADRVVIGRTPYEQRTAEIIGVARRFGIPVLMDVDDYVFDPRAIPAITEDLGLALYRSGEGEAQLNYWYAYVGRIRATMDLVDEIIVTNEFLAARTSDVIDKPVHVVRNFMGPEQIEYSDALYSARSALASRGADEPITIGYFSGTPTHERDFDVAADAIADVLNTHPNARLRIVGFLSLRNRNIRWPYERIETVPLTNYMDLQRLIASCEISISPLQNTMFTNCKSELKYFDAAIVGTPTINSATFTMSKAITDGVNGFVVKNDQWSARLHHLVDEYESVAPGIAAAARTHARENYRPEAALPEIVEALGIA